MDPKLIFSTKANTLKTLLGKQIKFNVLPQVSFTAANFHADTQRIKQLIYNEFDNQKLIVRSSAVTEDTANESLAGKFVSVLDVHPDDVSHAIQQVMQSFIDNNPQNQILVQPMLDNITMSGVLFTIDPNTGGNYFVINYDDNTGTTDSVTSGVGKNTSTCYIFRGKKSGNTRLDNLVEAAEELMVLFDKINIDIEFAFDENDTLYLLQVRPLVMKKEPVDFACQSVALERVYKYINNNMRPRPYVKGSRTIYGVMSDWNPAEMIGIRPKPLASSLYRRLITDGTWAYQRDEYGYKNLRSFPLMVEFNGLPYIDIRVSFNSFIPQSIDDNLSDKLTNYYLDRLADDPDKHDKVEFDVVFSCNTFDLPERINVLTHYGFTKEEQDALHVSLRKLTNTIVNVNDGLWITDTKKIDILDKRREIIIASDMDIISKIYWLLADCTRYGTLPFAGLARAGFIAVQLLKSLVAVGILSENEYENYMGSLNTIGSQISSDQRNLSLTAFIRKYGHLRPGTYDISSKRYDRAPEIYLSGMNTTPPEREKKPFSLTIDQYTAIQREMKNQGMDGDVLALFEFLKAGIEGREYAKFVFTKSLSYALELFAELGENYGFTREDMNFLDCFVMEHLYSSTRDIQSILANSIEKGRARYAETLSITMPPVILKPDDIYAFHMPSGIPNFITLKKVTGEICTGDLSREALAGKILLVSAADPGYDWIFSCDVLGFITAYGGANSHMAIRAGELGIPAVIGVGEKEYNKLSQTNILHINCANKIIEVIR
ncbi:MAG: PEP-utilizing enzyme [Defluviitaleaceae bacterium]|nr:PEP-utilizing enzyme [Defluviitaleaceae bacterium]